MSNKTKFDYEIENFIANFKDKKDKKIVLYGTGRMTATILQNDIGFNFVGVCDKDGDLTGTNVYGKPVLSKEEAEKADLLIINTSKTYWNTIYKRICNWKIPIYFLNGKCATLPTNTFDIENSYWNTSLGKLYQLIEMYDVVSFDIFDTLLMRKVLCPFDVFSLVSKELSLDSIDYVTVRKQAAANLENPTLEEIYMEIANILHLSYIDVIDWMKKEIQIEERLLAPREDMMELLNNISSSKTVYLISDMYLSGETLYNILKAYCIDIENIKILISSELKKTKESGELWKYYSEVIVKGRKAIHIGDNYINDYINAKNFGIDAYRIMSAYEMLESSSISEVLPVTETLYASVSLGLMCDKLFNSPFALNKQKGKVKFSDEYQAGYILLGPLMYCFIKWLIDNTHGKYDNIAFFSREGYLLIPLYNKMLELLGITDGAIPIYLEISRKVIWQSYIQNEKDVKEISLFPFQGDAKEWLLSRYGVDTNDIIDVNLSKQNLLEKYMKQILSKCRDTREGYTRYLSSLNLSNTAFVDSQYYGTTQYYLSRLLNKQTDGYYMCACLDEHNVYNMANNMRSCFPSVDSQVHNNAQFLEAYFTSPKGMLSKIGLDGTKYYECDMSNQKYFDIRFLMQEGIMDYMKDISEYNLDIDINWADNLFGIIFNADDIVTDKMRKSFFFDNGIMNNRESQIWE